jgi:hypothetical protein
MHGPNTKGQLSRRWLGTKDSNLPSLGRVVSCEGQPVRVIGAVTRLQRDMIATVDNGRTGGAP